MVGRLRVEVLDSHARERAAGGAVAVLFRVVARVVLRAQLGRHRAQLHADVFVGAAAEHLQVGVAIRRHHGDGHAQIVAVRDGLAVDVENDVASLEAALLGGTARAHVGHQRAARFLFAKLLGQIRRDVLRQDSQIRAGHLAVIDNLFHDVARHVRRDGKADSLIAFRPMSDDRRIDADQLAAVVHQRSAGISRIDGSVGLDEVLVVFNSQVRAAGGAHDAHGDRLAHAEGVAHSQSIIAHLDFRGVAHGDAGQAVRVDLYDRDVAFRDRCPRPWP